MKIGNKMKSIVVCLNPNIKNLEPYLKAIKLLNGVSSVHEGGGYSKTILILTKKEARETKVSDFLGVLTGCVSEEMLKLGIEVLGSKQKFKSWLRSDSFILGGRKPVDVLFDKNGEENIIETLHKIEHGRM